MESLAKTLSADEHERADRFTFPKHQHHFIVARGVLRNILSSYIGQEPGQVQLRYGSNGKPCLATPNDNNGNSNNIHFNLSHSHAYALYAIRKGCHIGVDIEYIRPVAHLEHIVARFFTAREQDDFHALAPKQRLHAFFNGWTRKEAYLKARGYGLAKELHTIEVTICPNQPAALRNTHSSNAPTDWCIHHLTPVPGYVGAVIWEGEHVSPSVFMWECSS